MATGCLSRYTTHKVHFLCFIKPYGTSIILWMYNLAVRVFIFIFNFRVHTVQPGRGTGVRFPAPPLILAPFK